MAPAVERWPAGYPAGPVSASDRDLDEVRRPPDGGKNRPVLTTNLHFREGKPPEFCVNSTAAITPQFSMWLFSLRFSGRRYRRYRALFRGDNAFALRHASDFVMLFVGALSALSILSAVSPCLAFGRVEWFGPTAGHSAQCPSSQCISVLIEVGCNGEAATHPALCHRWQIARKSRAC